MIVLRTAGFGVGAILVVQNGGSVGIAIGSTFGFFLGSILQEYAKPKF